jgi:hypothetical protein
MITTLIVLLVVIILLYFLLRKSFDPGNKNASGDLIFRTILVPHAFVYLAVTVLVASRKHLFGRYLIGLPASDLNRYYASEPINLFLLITYIFGLGGLFVIPVIIELLEKNYRYMGINTDKETKLDHLKYAKSNDPGVDMKKYDFPNTLKINLKSISSQEMLDELLLEYETALFALIAVRTFLSIIVLVVAFFVLSSSTLIYLVLILYYNWIRKRRINPKLLRRQFNVHSIDQSKI